MLAVDPGNLFIVTAPSGAGKTSLVRTLVDQLSNIEISISHTTRQARPGERNGLDYYFIDQEKFEHMLQMGSFIEHAKVFNYYYGTEKSQVDARIAAGTDIVFDIDWQGADQLKKLFPQAQTIFIMPPSLDVLKNRLITRNQDHPQVIQYRMEQVSAELSHYQTFDYVIINDTFEHASNELQAIILADRKKISRQTVKLTKLLSILSATM